MPLLFSVPSHAEDGEFLAFRDEGPALGPMGPAVLATNLSGIKALVDTPQLWQTRVTNPQATGTVSGPAATGLFTPRFAGAEITLMGDEQTIGREGLGLTLTSTPVTLAGVSPTGQSQATNSALINDEQSYNLGVNVSIARFQVGAALSRVSEPMYELDATGVDVDMRYLGDSWQTNLALHGTMAANTTAGTLGQGLGLVHDQSFAVEWGASYYLTPRLSLGGSLRFSGFRDEAVFGDVVTTDSAVFLGTNFKF